MAAQQLDLTKPGRIWAIPEFEATTTFHMLVPQGKYTKDAIIANPSIISPADQLMAPFSVPTSGLTKDGKAEFDLKKTNRGKEIMDKIEARMKQGELLGVVRSVIIASAKDGNRNPPKQAVEVLDLDVLPVPTITLTPTDGFITIQNWNAGRKAFKVDLMVAGPLSEVILEITPAKNINTSAGVNGGAKIKIPVKAGQKVAITIPDIIVYTKNTRTVYQDRQYHHYVPGGWRTNNRMNFYNAVYEQESYVGGDFTLRASGTGFFQGVFKTVQLRAETTYGQWLEKNPPPPLGHNVC